MLDLTQEELDSVSGGSGGFVSKLPILGLIVAQEVFSELTAPLNNALVNAYNPNAATDSAPLLTRIVEGGKYLFSS
ncbi:hypothetical protein [Pseudomonas sp. PA15(2017)]|uniref:hypothetical protein n=1 Tax=Pseudomonas sp. PA15(2017) TaxID=1932111 RepID=UPI0011798DE2|nr:hypothetical protein [Pseudomonas sp. PA15(2017)]